MSLDNFLRKGLLLVAVIGLVAVTASPALAATREERAIARAERDAQRAIDRAERDAEREARRSGNDEGQNEESNEEATCSCSSRLSFARPQLQWRGGVLTIIPRVDVDIRTKGEQSDGDWAAHLFYEGSAMFESEDVVAPGSVVFNGSQEIQSGQCGDNRYSFTGLALPEITLPGLLRSLVGFDQELDGTVKMKAHIEGCGFDEEYQQFGFNVEEFGNLDVGRWKRAR